MSVYYFNQTDLSSKVMKIVHEYSRCAVISKGLTKKLQPPDLSLIIHKSKLRNKWVESIHTITKLGKLSTRLTSIGC